MSSRSSSANGAQHFVIKYKDPIPDDQWTTLHAVDVVISTSKPNQTSSGIDNFGLGKFLESLPDKAGLHWQLEYRFTSSRCGSKWSITVDAFRSEATCTIAVEAVVARVKDFIECPPESKLDKRPLLLSPHRLHTLIAGNKRNGTSYTRTFNNCQMWIIVHLEDMRKALGLTEWELGLPEGYHYPLRSMARSGWIPLSFTPFVFVVDVITSAIENLANSSAKSSNKKPSAPKKQNNHRSSSSRRSWPSQRNTEEGDREELSMEYKWL